MAEVYTGASTWMLQVLSKNEYPVIMLQTSFSCTSDAVTAKTFTCYPQLTWHPAVCYYIVASPALSGTINLPSPFSPITDQLTDLLELSDLPLLPLHPQPVQEASPAPILAMEKTVTDSVAALQKCDEVWACHISITPTCNKWGSWIWDRCDTWTSRGATMQWARWLSRSPWRLSSDDY